MGRNLSEIESLLDDCDRSLCEDGCLTRHQYTQLLSEARRMIKVQRSMAERIRELDHKKTVDAARELRDFGKKPGDNVFDDLFGTMFGGKKP